MHVEFYTAAKYGDNIAMRGAHAVNRLGGKSHEVDNLRSGVLLLERRV